MSSSDALAQLLDEHWLHVDAAGRDDQHFERRRRIGRPPEPAVAVGAHCAGRPRMVTSAPTTGWPSGTDDAAFECDSRAGGDEQSEQPNEECWHVRRNRSRVRTRANYYQRDVFRLPVARSLL